MVVDAAHIDTHLASELPHRGAADPVAIDELERRVEELLASIHLMEPTGLANQRWLNYLQRSLKEEAMMGDAAVAEARSSVREQIPWQALPPGPRVPVAWQTVRWGLRPVQFLSRCQRRYGDTFTIRFPERGHSVVLTSPESVKQVFGLGADEFSVIEASAVLLEPFLGSRSLLLLDGDAHRRERKMLAQSFHGEGLATHRPIVDEAAERDLATWPTGKAFGVRPHMQAVTLEVILRAVFGIAMDENFDALKAAFERFLSDGSSNLILLPPARKDFGSRSPWGRFVRNRAHVHGVVREEITARRKVPDLHDRTDLLSFLLRARDDDGNALDDASLLDELMTMLLAGQDTTATALAWAVDLLAHHPTALERLVSDLDDGSETYLDAVVREVLRLRPVIPDIARTLTRAMTIDGYKLPSGTNLTCNIALLHRRPELFDDPLAFRPERFLDQPADYNTWVPFGGGIRRCLGAAFATMEIRIVLSTILRRFRLRPARSRLEPARRRAVTLVPRSGARVVAVPR